METVHGYVYEHSDEILEKVFRLVSLYKSGALGGERMPEDENPGLEKSSAENYMYFTLPMALNYQRNSYVLWQCANEMYKDELAREVFDSLSVCSMPMEQLRDILVRYKVALQPNKQPVIWQKLCETIENRFDGDIRKLFVQQGYSAAGVKGYIAGHKKEFPYLGGNKICNYWLYVLEQYTDIRFIDREAITVAPDTHVIQASIRLGVITREEGAKSNVQLLTADRWRVLLQGTELAPIDVHTPMWLWSRGDFCEERVL